MNIGTGLERATVGFIGTGIMGFHMARRLAQAGHSVQVWNRNPTRPSAWRFSVSRSARALQTRPAMPTS